jgi:hypothetical protein
MSIIFGEEEGGLRHQNPGLLPQASLCRRRRPGAPPRAVRRRGDATGLPAHIKNLATAYWPSPPATAAVPSLEKSGAVCTRPASQIKSPPSTHPPPPASKKVHRQIASDEQASPRLKRQPRPRELCQTVHPTGEQWITTTSAAEPVGAKPRPHETQRQSPSIRQSRSGRASMGRNISATWPSADDQASNGRQRIRAHQRHHGGAEHGVDISEA